MPERCPVAPESREFVIEVRQLLYGKRRNAYRVLFSVAYDNEADENVVRIYRIRHGAQRRLKDLELLGEMWKRSMPKKNDFPAYWFILTASWRS
ncbi:MAG: hypothetical protein M3430_05665 [Acidobacteriota bacterium]|nr:hypothetical protein [Acidobacteriota bacterium]